jgi:hypothetical protein
MRSGMSKYEQRADSRSEKGRTVDRARFNR